MTRCTRSSAGEAWPGSGPVSSAGPRAGRSVTSPAPGGEGPRARGPRGRRRGGGAGGRAGQQRRVEGEPLGELVVAEAVGEGRLTGRGVQGAAGDDEGADVRTARHARRRHRRGSAPTWPTTA